MRIYSITVGEENPDRGSRLIQRGLTLKHGFFVNKSHSCLLVEDAGKYSGVWESLGNGFHGPKDPIKALEGGIIRDKVLLNIRNDAEAIRWLREFVGTGYANLQYLLFVPKWLAVTTSWAIPRFIMRFIKNGKMLSFCSESVAHFIRNNCVDAEGKDAIDDPVLTPDACDHIDPVLIVPLSERYGVRV